MQFIKNIVEGRLSEEAWKVLEPLLRGLGWPVISLLLLIFISSILIISKKYTWRFHSNWIINLDPHFSLQFLSKWPVKVLIPLDRASLSAYEKLRHTAIGRAAESLSGGEPLTWMAILIYKKAELYGIHPPSSKIERINRNHMGSIQDDGRSIVDSYGKVIFSSIMIERNSFKRFISTASISLNESP